VLIIVVLTEIYVIKESQTSISGKIPIFVLAMILHHFMFAYLIFCN